MSVGMLADWDIWGDVNTVRFATATGAFFTVTSARPDGPGLAFSMKPRLSYFTNWNNQTADYWQDEAGWVVSSFEGLRLHMIAGIGAYVPVNRGKGETKECELCKRLVSTAEQAAWDRTQIQIGKKIIEFICAEMGLLDSLCDAAIEPVIEKIVEWISEDKTEVAICGDLLHLCKERTGFPGWASARCAVGGALFIWAVIYWLRH